MGTIYRHGVTPESTFAFPCTFVPKPAVIRSTFSCDMAEVLMYHIQYPICCWGWLWVGCCRCCRLATVVLVAGLASVAVDVAKCCCCNGRCAGVLQFYKKGLQKQETNACCVCVLFSAPMLLGKAK
eukprot:4234559-Amphidinium_carterae.1